MAKYLKDSWIKLVDWSRMKNTFERLPKDRQNIILNEGTWSKGKGVFDVEWLEKHKPTFDDAVADVLGEIR